MVTSIENLVRTLKPATHPGRNGPESPLGQASLTGAPSRPRRKWKSWAIGLVVALAVAIIATHQTLTSRRNAQMLAVPILD